MMNAFRGGECVLVIPATTVSGCGAISVYTVAMPDVDDLQETFFATTWDLHGFDHMGLAVVHAQTELAGGAGETENVRPCASTIPSGVVAGEAVSRVHSLTWWRRGPVEGGVVMRGGHRGSWSHVGVAAERKRTRGALEPARRTGISFT